jgi:hypothetical protein
MTSHEGTSTNKPPLFDGTNFSFWKVRMRTYIMALGVDVWDVVETGYTKPVVLASKDDKLEFSFNAKAMNAILSGLAEAEFVKVMHLDSAKEMWDKLISSYEGNEKVKDAKLQTYRLKFEQLKMNEDETISKYFLRVEELVNVMKGLGDKIEDTFLVQKILRSLPNRFNPKVSAIEELNDLKILSIDQLLGTLTAYEMRISKDKPTSREASFKEDKNEDSEPDEIEAKFVRRLKKGSGKYQGKFPFKCFNCGKIGHFASKCPHKKKDQNSEGEEKYKSKRFGKKKSLCVNNDDSSGDTDSDSSCEDKVNEFMLMAKEDYDNKITGSDVNDEEVVVDLEGELISALEEIARLRFKKKKKKQLLMQFEKDSKKPDEDFALLKVELEEAKKIEDILKQQLSEKKARCEALEEEVVKTRKEMEKFKALYLQNIPSIKASTELNDILRKQRSPLLKTGLGYVSGSSSKQTESKEPVKMIKFQVSRQSDHVSTLPPKANKDKMIPDKKQRYQKMEQQMPRRRPSFRYQNFFHGYCFYCSNFGHKIANCQIKFRDMQLRRSRNKQSLQHRTKQPMSRQSCTNHFDLLNNELKCYNCHNFGHKAANCHLKNYKADPRIKPLARNASTWKKKDSEKCGLVLSAQRQKNPWYIDSGCSKHMTGDKSKFLSLSESKSGNVTFGNDAPGKIKGKGMVSLSNGKGKAQDVLFVDGLKHNLLSVSQVCDRGCKVVFTSKDCKIQSVNSGQLIAKGIRTENNVYVLKEEKEECHLSKYDESWLWHRRLGHLNFDHLIKLRNSGAVKDLPKISKPYDSVCKPCQIGKLTRTQFKSKNFASTEKPLQLVHMDLCGPSRKEGTGK